MSRLALNKISILNYKNILDKTFNFDNKINEDDELFKFNDEVKVVIDKTSLDFLKGSPEGGQILIFTSLDNIAL